MQYRIIIDVPFLERLRDFNFRAASEALLNGDFTHFDHYYRDFQHWWTQLEQYKP